MGKRGVGSWDPKLDITRMNWRYFHLHKDGEFPALLLTGPLTFVSIYSMGWALPMELRIPPITFISICKLKSSFWVSLLHITCQIERRMKNCTQYIFQHNAYIILSGFFFLALVLRFHKNEMNLYALQHHLIICALSDQLLWLFGLFFFGGNPTSNSMKLKHLNCIILY